MKPTAPIRQKSGKTSRSPQQNATQKKGSAKQSQEAPAVNPAKKKNQATAPSTKKISSGKPRAARQEQERTERSRFDPSIEIIREEQEAPEAHREEEQAQASAHEPSDEITTSAMQDPPKEEEGAQIDPIKEPEQSLIPPDPAPPASASQPVAQGERHDLQGELEALLFAAGKAMSIDTLAILTGARRSSVKKALAALKEAYEKKGGALFLFEEGETWKFSVKERHSSLVRKIVPEMELSKSILETLAVVAWKTPILQSELVRIRSTKVYDHVPQLEELGFIVREKKGRSFQLRVTQKFFDYFELDGAHHIKTILSDVPGKQAEAASAKAQTTLDAHAAQEDKNATRDPDANVHAPSEAPEGSPDSGQSDAESNGRVEMTEDAPADNPPVAPEKPWSLFPEEKEDAPATAAAPPPEDDIDAFLKNIDQKIDDIAKKHDEIELRREEYFFESQEPQAQAGASPVNAPQNEMNSEEHGTDAEGAPSSEPEPSAESASNGSPDAEYDRRLAEKMRVALERQKQKDEETRQAEEVKKNGGPTKTQLKKNVLADLERLKQKPRRLSAIRNRSAQKTS